MLSVVVPAYNEDKRIGPSLTQAFSFLDQLGLDYEIVVVDDGSSDHTTDVVRELATERQNLKLVRYGTNRGKGYALRTGVLATDGGFVLVMDADLSTPMEELRKLMPYVSERGFDIAIGSRALALSDIIKKQPWWRRSMGKAFNRIARVLVIAGFCDTQCGFKLFQGKTARRLFKKAKIDRFAYDVEILALAAREGCKIAEVPVRWINSPESKVDPLKDSLQMLSDLVRIRLALGKSKGKRR